MALEAGSRLGHYEILSSLGAGGMGEVYRAKDTKLGREVAVKLLLKEVADDPDRLARFEREARVLASLNHANIASLHAFEREGGTSFLVMELVEGETLAERIARGPLAVGDAISVFLQIAEGLEEAHAEGVIHRDLKPANIKLSNVGDDQRVKILDFGLAKALAPEEPAAGETAVSESPTLTLAATMRGEILGTAAYMSPEQAAGKAVDKRTDVWAFGACLYEALTGRRAFGAEDVANTLAAVLRDEIDFAHLPPSCPPALRRCLERCLTRDRRQRLHDIADARLELEGAGTERADPEPAQHRPTRRNWALAAAVGSLGLLLGVLGSRLIAPAPGEPGVSASRVERFVLSTEDRVGGFAAMSPDGSTVAYTTTEGIWIRELSLVTPRLVPDSDRAALLFWSPDSKWLGFSRRQALWKIPANGGEPVEICELPVGELTSASWGSDNGILFVSGYGGRGDPLYRVSASGGAVEIHSEPDSSLNEASFVAVTHLPDGTGLLVIVRHDDETYHLQVKQQDRRWTLASRSYFDTLAYSPTGHVLYGDFLEEGDLWAVPFSTSDPATKREPLLLQGGATLPSVAADGTLVYTASEYAGVQLAWVSRSGALLEKLAEPMVGIFSPRISPDGQYAAFTSVQGQETNNLHLLRVDRGAPTRLTTGANLVTAAFSPVGDRVFFSDSIAGGDIVSLPLDGSGEPELLFGENTSDWSPDWSPDGRYLAFYRLASDSDTRRDLWLWDTETASEIAYLQTRHDEIHPRISPDGRLLAYQSNDQGRWEIYVDTFPEASERRRISEDGGQQPTWSAAGELFFVNQNQMMAVSFDGPGSGPRDPEVLFTGDDVGTELTPRVASFESTYDVSADGQRFLVALGRDRGKSEVVLVRNWEHELSP